MTENIFKSFPKIKWTFLRIGTSEVATAPMGVNVADSCIILKDKSEWPKSKDGRKRTSEELVARIIAKSEKNLPGMKCLQK